MRVVCIDDSYGRGPSFWSVKAGVEYTVSMVFEDGITLLEDTQVHPLGTFCTSGSGRYVCADGRFSWNKERFVRVDGVAEINKESQHKGRLRCL